MRSNRRYKCPNCGELFARLDVGLIPTHDYPKPTRTVCPGSKQYPRDVSDKRDLWKDERVALWPFGTGNRCQSEPTKGGGA